MKPNYVVRSVMNKLEIGVSKLADRMGKTPRLVCDRLSQENISTEKLNELLRVMDYKIVVVPSDTKLQDDWFEID